MVVKLEGGGSKSKSKSEREIIQKNNGNKKIKKLPFCALQASLAGMHQIEEAGPSSSSGCLYPV